MLRGRLRRSALNGQVQAASDLVPPQILAQAPRLRYHLGVWKSKNSPGTVKGAVRASPLLSMAHSRPAVGPKQDIVGKAGEQDSAATDLLLVVAVALLDDQGRVLLAQRVQGKQFAGMWEFPGGKVNVKERPETALIRELQEELGVKVEEADLKPLMFASHRDADFHLLMPLYVCTRWEGSVQGREGQGVEWCDIAELRRRHMPPADLPLIPAVEEAAQQHAQCSFSLAT